MRFILLVLLFTSCVTSPDGDKRKAIAFSKKYCSCRGGIFLMEPLYGSFYVTCNDGRPSFLTSYESEYYGKVCDD